MQVPKLTESPVLCVDLDGTLIRSDTLFETALAWVREHPLELWRLLIWLFQGRAVLKRQLALAVRLDPSALPYNAEFLEWLRQEHKRGRRLVLATAADDYVAKSVAEYLGIFDLVIASDGRENCKGRLKLERLRQLVGRPFEYAGNSSADLPIWRECEGVVLVCAPARVRARAGRVTQVRAVFGTPRRFPLLRSLRPHQWSKNLLVFVPAITSHKIFDLSIDLTELKAMVAFCLCASSAYIINDLLDLSSDRQHPLKKLRPLASGDISFTMGLATAGGTLAIGYGIAIAFLPPLFALALSVYVVVTLAYSVYLKRMPLVDVFTLTGLYVIRVMAGNAATGIRYSAWLINSSMFLFLSLALAKRVAELRARGENASANRRAYVSSDLQTLAGLGIASGILSVLVLALYINSDDVRLLYRHPEYLWLMTPAALFWIARIWMLVGRGEMDEDPILFAIRDRATYLVAAIVVAVMVVASMYQ